MLSFQPQLPGNRLNLLTSSNDLRLSSQLSFSSLRSVDLQNNFGPSAQNKEPINTGLNISDYAAASNNHGQHSKKVRSSVFHTLPILLPLTTCWFQQKCSVLQPGALRKMKGSSSFPEHAKIQIAVK